MRYQTTLFHRNSTNSKNNCRGTHLGSPHVGEGSQRSDVTAMAFHGATRIKDAVAIAAHKSCAALAEARTCMWCIRVKCGPRVDRDWHKPSVNCCKTVAANKTNRRLKQLCISLKKSIACMLWYHGRAECLTVSESASCSSECRMLHASFCINLKTIKFWRVS
jgi:hypothetical protein